MVAPALAVIISGCGHAAITFDVAPLTPRDFVYILRSLTQEYITEIFRYFGVSRAAVSKNLLPVEKNYIISEALGSAQACVIIGGKVFDANKIYYDDLIYDEVLLEGNDDSFSNISASVNASFCTIQDPESLLEYLNT